LDGISREIKIAGRADRFDIHVYDDNAVAVIDYKNQSMKKITKRAEQILNDPQLLIYARAANENPVAAHLPGRSVIQAEWVSLKAVVDKGEAKNIRANAVEDIPNLMDKFSTQIEKDLNVFWARQPMQAFAPDSVGKYCEGRGICRKGMW